MAAAQSTVSSGSPEYRTVTIQSGQTQSNIVNVDGRLVGIIIPNAFTAANLTFNAGQTNSGLTAIWDNANATAAARSIPSANIPTTGGRFLPLSLNDWISVQWIQIVSSANQAQDTPFTLVLAG